MKANRIILIFALLSVASCSRDESLPEATRSFMQVEIRQHAGQGAERIETIRFIVFTDLLSAPRAEVNRLYTEAEFIGGDTTGASEVGIVLEVGYRPGRSNEKLAVAIVNEPSKMSRALDAVAAPEELERLKMALSYFVADDHLALREQASMPMSGAVWSDRVYPSAQQASQNAVGIVLSRAVARIEVYLDTDTADGMQIVGGSRVTLGNTCADGYLVRHEDEAGHILGNLRSVAPGELMQKSWTLAAERQEVPHADSGSMHLCTFYTPERHCHFDHPELTIDVVTSEGAPRSGTLKLDRAVESSSQSEKPIEAILRNSTYRIYATIGANTITAIVNDWNEQQINSEL